MRHGQSTNKKESLLIRNSWIYLPQTDPYRKKLWDPRTGRSREVLLLKERTRSQDVQMELERCFHRTTAQSNKEEWMPCFFLCRRTKQWFHKNRCPSVCATLLLPSIMAYTFICKQYPYELEQEKCNCIFFSVTGFWHFSESMLYMDE